jgi:predicted DsbA family dithiol-disulfide isomerase
MVHSTGMPTTVLHWYDFLCPFCYVAQHRTAILVRHGLQVVEMPFQIHPEIPPGGIEVGPRNGPMYTMLEREAKAAGLPLNWPARLPDTRRALAIAEWVRTHDERAFPQLHKQLFDAHFVLGEDLGDPEVLDGHAKSCGVDLASLHAALADGSAEAVLVEAEALGRKYGIGGTPAWLLPQGLISGLRSAADFERLAEQASAAP